MSSGGELTPQMLADAMQKLRDQPYEVARLPPMHPKDYAYIQRDLGTTEPLTEQQVIEWGFRKIFETADQEPT